MYLGLFVYLVQFIYLFICFVFYIGSVISSRIYSSYRKCYVVTPKHLNLQTFLNTSNFALLIRRIKLNSINDFDKPILNVYLFFTLFDQFQSLDVVTNVYSFKDLVQSLFLIHGCHTLN